MVSLPHTLPGKAEAIVAESPVDVVDSRYGGHMGKKEQVTLPLVQ